MKHIIVMRCIIVSIRGILFVEVVSLVDLAEFEVTDVAETAPRVVIACAWRKSLVGRQFVEYWLDVFIVICKTGGRVGAGSTVGEGRDAGRKTLGYWPRVEL